LTPDRLRSEGISLSPDNPADFHHVRNRRRRD
jgi:hypothetical protein